MSAQVGVVVLTHNRRRQLVRTLERMVRLDDAGPIAVVDNASTDGTRDAIAGFAPRVKLVRLQANLGAAGRNAGVAELPQPYIAFCDDDTWWERGALGRGAQVLDAFPKLAVLSARILVGDRETEDPASMRMGASPFANELGFPGTEVVGFMAGGCIMRRRAFLEVGGYHPRLFLGGEETLLAIDLLVAGWHMGYLPELVVHHHPSSLRDAARRRELLARNALWCALLRRPMSCVLAEARRMLGQPHGRRRWRSVAATLGALPWILRERQVVPARVEAALARRDAFDAAWQHGAPAAAAAP
jgi:GT2 family glycosyltransferase